MARQALPVVGAVIGAIYGGPSGAMWGWQIGSLVGNVVDPQVIKGPSLGDISQQTSQEGGPRPIVFGLSAPISGNIIYTSAPDRKYVKQDSGKGGPVVKDEHVYRTYAIGICEGPIADVVRVWRNGALVYDKLSQYNLDIHKDPNKYLNEVYERNNGFLSHVKFYTGSYEQPQESHLVALLGAENCPFFRGTAYMVVFDEDLTDLQGAIPQYTFQVERCPGDTLTSKPYPSMFSDEVGAGVDEFSVTIRVNHHSGQVHEVVGTGFSDAMVQVRDVKHKAFPLENMTASVYGITPSIKNTRFTTDFNDNMGTSFLEFEVGLPRTFIQYRNWPVESFTTMTGNFTLEIKK